MQVQRRRETENQAPDLMCEKHLGHLKFWAKKLRLQETDRGHAEPHDFLKRGPEPLAKCGDLSECSL